MNNTKRSSPREGKLSLKLVAIEIEPGPFFRTRSFRQLWRWRDARSETANIWCEDIGTVWNGVRPALRCLDITCLCILCFLRKDFSQTEQNQLMSTLQEQNVDWEKGRILLIYIGFQVIKFYCFPFSSPPAPTPPPPPHFYCFPSSFSSSSFLLFSLLLLLLLLILLVFVLRLHISFVQFPPPLHSIVFYPSSTRFIFFFSSRFYERLPTAIPSSFWSNVSWVNNNRGFLQLLVDCPAYIRASSF